jgi:hypothetical protein
MSSAPSSPTRRRRCLELPALWAGTALVVGSAAAAAQSSPYYVAGSLAVAQDSNLQRLADDDATPSGSSRSDTVYSTALIGGINQAIGRQRVYGSLTLRDNRFERNKQFDNQSYNGTLGLDWATVQRLSGSLSLSAVRALSPFNADGVGRLTEKNLETTQSANALVRVGLVTAYSLELSGGVRRVRNSLDQGALQARNFNQDNLSLGVGWRPGGALAISIAVREVNGEYPTFRRNVSTGEFDSDRFKQQFFDLVSTWQPTGASLLDLRMNFADTKYLVNANRDFASVNGALGWQWQATGKLRLNLRYSSDQGQDSYPGLRPLFVTGFPFGVFPVVNNDSRTVSTYRVQGEFEVGSKLTLSAGLQHAARKLWRNITIPPGGFDAVASLEARDRSDQITLGARWAPWRATLFGCDLSDDRREFSGSRELSSPFKNAGLNCFGQLTLQ